MAPKPVAPLSVLPLTTVLRTLATTTVSSSRLLLPPSLAIMTLLAHSNNSLLNPDKNPPLRWFMKKTFYAQFCAGENATEVRRTVDGLRNIGFTGVILGYAKEVVLTEAQERDLSACDEGADAEACIRDEIVPWKQGTLETLRLARTGDFVALKFSGAGRQALYALKNRLPPPRYLKGAIDEICDLAVERDVPLLFDAEQTVLQAGIDDWTLVYQRKYNTTPGHAIVYGTYQAYLKSTPATLSSHLSIASREGFTLGAKLVRGAYLGSDPREIIHDTKADTDRAYDGIAASLIRKSWGDYLKPQQPPASPQHPGQEIPFPQISIVLGSHNLASVRKARAVRDDLLAVAVDNYANSAATTTPTAGEPKEHAASPKHPELAIAQLQGMADEVSCELLLTATHTPPSSSSSSISSPARPATTPDGKHQTTTTTIVASRSEAEEKNLNKNKNITRAYKYIVWGTTKECMKYLLRRAYENRDAVQRTRDGRDAMWAEVKRRVRAGLGMMG
ncbi:proline dehydrogenase [Xylariomycetidae sp. FL2044]|nr:proline dehydrogenase [Xylariomycetidae sp. FL2044]